MKATLHPEQFIAATGPVGAEQERTHEKIVRALNAGGGVIGAGIDVVGAAVNNGLHISRALIMNILGWTKTIITGHK